MGMSSTTKSVSENKPPAWAKPLFTKSAKEALSLYNNKSGFNVYDGPTVAGLSGTTKGGMNVINTADNMANSGQFNRAGGIFSQIGQQAMRPGAAEKYLTGTARGDYLKGSPFLSDMMARDTADIADATSAMYAAGGRYGSGAAAGGVADAIGDYRTKTLQQNYQQERDRQLMAGQALEQAQNQGYQTAGQAAGQMADLAQNRVNNALNVGQAQIGAGQLLDKRAQDELNARIQKWSAKDQQDWTRLGALQAAAQGAAGPYGTGVSSQTTPGNPLQTVGVLASLLGAFSDVRVKADIKQVGTTVHELPLYEFRYKGGRERYRGVMAQDVVKVRPDAVYLHPDDGLYRVRYGMLGIEMERA